VTPTHSQDRTIFLVDGFNLYHSLRQAQSDLAQAGEPSGTKWLDLFGLCRAHLSSVSATATLSEVRYFTALAGWSQAKLRRHEDYLECLKATGVRVRVGRFKDKVVTCRARCGQKFLASEEKETDVAIGVALLAVLFENRCENAVILSADSDYVPAVEEAKRLFPDKRVLCAFPYARNSEDLRRVARVFRLSRESYVKHPLPDPFVLTPTRSISKPAGW